MLEKYKIISTNQFGFMRNRSTEDAIACLTSNIYNALNQNECPMAVFLDLTKAFDTVSHEKLLEKLYNYGVRGKAHHLIRSYLSQRYQYTNVNGTESNAREIKYGVPQGTVLGPLLFIIYINDMLLLPTNGLKICFADDTTLFCTSKTWTDVKNKVEKDMDKITTWLNENMLTLNQDKSKYLCFICYADDQPKLGQIQIADDKYIKNSDNIK